MFGAATAIAEYPDCATAVLDPVKEVNCAPCRNTVKHVAHQGIGSAPERKAECDMLKFGEISSLSSAKV